MECRVGGGKVMSAEQAIEYALQQEAVLEPAAPEAYPAGLSAREVEVLRLVARYRADQRRGRREAFPEFPHRRMVLERDPTAKWGCTRAPRPPASPQNTTSSEGVISVGDYRLIFPYSASQRSSSLPGRLPNAGAPASRTPGYP